MIRVSSAVGEIIEGRAAIIRINSSSNYSSRSTSVVCFACSFNRVIVRPRRLRLLHPHPPRDGCFSGSSSRGKSHSSLSHGINRISKLHRVRFSLDFARRITLRRLLVTPFTEKHPLCSQTRSFQKILLHGLDEPAVSRARRSFRIYGMPDNHIIFHHSSSGDSHIRSSLRF